MPAAGHPAVHLSNRTDHTCLAPHQSTLPPSLNHAQTLPKPCPLQEVERYYTTSGFMLPSFHRFYWLGLASGPTTWPNFTWVGNSTPGPSNSSSYYSHWGRFRPGGTVEPNNLVTPPEHCGGANASEAYGTVPATWGWADWHCGAKWPVLCKLRPPLVASCLWQVRPPRCCSCATLLRWCLYAIPCHAIPPAALCPSALT